MNIGLYHRVFFRILKICHCEGTMLFLSILYYFSLPQIESFVLGPETTQHNATTMTSCGMVQGLWMDNAFEFRGIPYASAPVGNLRWRPPVPLNLSNNNCWSGTYNATVFGSVCFQRNFNVSGDQILPYQGSEDCLYLNVWTPDVAPTSGLPVMVWLHGGSLQLGSGNIEGYRPTAKLARQTNIVYVSMNYRLHALGFMALDWLKQGSPTNTSGNYGLMDQIEALRWVQENIRSFGGDPSQVTLFGQSSGGTAAFALLASPLCRGLFHKAWLMSASPILNKTAEDAFRDNSVFVNNTGCDDVDCLYRLSPEEVMSHIPWLEYPYWAMTDQSGLPERGRFDGALAIIDGYVLKEAPFDAWVHGNGVDVPLLIGTTAQEVDNGARPKAVRNWTWATDDYEKHVRVKLSVFSDLIAEMAIKLYPVNISTPAYQLISMISDVRVNCANDYLSLVAATSFKSPVYRYVTTFIPSVPFHNSTFSYHSMDAYAFFGSSEQNFDRVTGREANCRNNIQAESMSFVEKGRPDTVAWLPYPESTALFSENTNVTRGYHIPECQFWMGNGFYSYAWVN